ncbi:GAF domain-containing protein [Chroococcidiopsis sp.]|uniref:GAF domain-containing protein n=1 Tax=Chroococcidiopsis sp. TaxID=3088168 RepID=UPI003F2ED30A
MDTEAEKRDRDRTLQTEFTKCQQENQYLRTQLAQLQQENDRLQSELIQQRQECDRLRQSEARSRQASLLSTVAQIANLLLRSPDRTTVLPDVVRLLGKAVGSDRCCLTQDVAHPETGVPAVRILMEWCQVGVSPSIDSTPDLETGVPWENFAQFRENYLQGVVSNYLVADLPEPTRSIFLEQSLTSILVVPILVKGQSWGQIGFDNCGEPRLYDEAEIAILQVAADSIAAAIERQEKDEELLRLEQARSQELERHNAELQQTLDRLSESEERYRSLFEMSNEGIYRYEIEQPFSISLSVDDQVEYLYQHFRLVDRAIGKCGTARLKHCAVNLEYCYEVSFVWS